MNKDSKKTNNDQESFSLALKYLSQRAKSKKEVEEYLEKKGFDSPSIKAAINRLLELKFLDDKEFSSMFARGKQLQGKSKKFISYELSKKGVLGTDISKTMDEAEDDFKIALDYIEKRLHQFERFDKLTRRRRIISRLQSRGFGWDVINKVLKKLEL